MAAPSHPQESTSRVEEKRRTQRVRLVCPITYQRLVNGTPTGPVLTATTVNLSVRGLMFASTQPCDLGAELRLQLQPPTTGTIALQGRVVHIEELKQTPPRYTAGIQFDQSEELSEASAYLDRLVSLDLRQMLELLLKMNGSDLHLTTGNPPLARVRGRLAPMKWPALQPGEIRALLYGLMSEQQIAILEQYRELDFAYSLSINQRFRVNVHWQRGQVEAAIRVIPAQVSDWKSLGVPPVVIEWTDRANGLILIVGPTGAGKTTTLNSLVHHINQQRDAIIICLERPIEYVHRNIKSIIKQREIGADTLSYAEAVKRALRQDPDVIVVGEVDDAETGMAVLNAAETGNLVLASFHATDTTQAVDRFLNLFPTQQRGQVAFQLASLLRGILTQYLLQKEEAVGGGLVLATEIFVPTEGTRSMIRGNSLGQIQSAIQTGGNYRMHTLEMSLRQLVTQGLVEKRIADNLLALVAGRAI